MILGEPLYITSAREFGEMKNKAEPVAELVESFADAVMKHGEFMFKDSGIANRWYERSLLALKKLHQRGDAGLSALALLLDDERIVVRVTAACYLIRQQTEQAMRVLQDAARSADRGTSMLAIATLERWKRGAYLDMTTGKEVHGRKST
jgi:hypothetical protein